jgi:gamma-glutamyltranspeptidase/glutathione hydrolase
MVASAHPLASLAGVDVLRSGGNAADAAIAMNAVLTVTQPCYCGLGGDFFALVYDAGGGTVHFLNGAGRSGERATLDELHRRNLGSVPEVGPASVSVPGVTRAWAMLRERFGTLSLKQLLAPAIEYASDGFAVSDIVCQAIRERTADITDAEWHSIFVPEGRVPRPGDCFRQADLGRTLSELADDPDAFYQGRVARAISDRLVGEGFLTSVDLAQHSGEWGDAISTGYRRCTVYQTPPPTQGLAALIALGILDGFDVAAHAPDSADRLHLLLEATRLAYADRDRWVADPRCASVPVERLLAPEHAMALRRGIQMNSASSVPVRDGDGDTTGFVVADAAGNMVAGIQSLFKVFGSGVVVPSTGVVLHNRGAQFNTSPAHPNCLAPRKRPFHTLVASVVTRGREPVIGYATSGGDGQAMFHVQGLSNLIDHGMNVQEAIERPRFVCGRLGGGGGQVTVQLEARAGAETIEDLRRRGHAVRVLGDFAHQTGHAHGVTRLAGTLTGGADPRGDGAALGF